MPRPPRIQYENAIYHIIAKGNGGQKIFLNDSDREKYLRCLKEAQLKFDLEIFCFALLDNHFHLTLRARHSNLSKAMQWLQTSYSVYHNVKYERSGHLFSGRFKSLLVENERYLLALSYYVHLNPVKAGIAEKPWDYKWSSCRTYSGRAPDLDWLASATILHLFSSQSDRQKKLYRDALKESFETALSIEKNVRRGLPLGGDEFKAKIYKKIEDKRGGRPHPKSALKADEIIKSVAKYFNCEKFNVLSGGRGRINLCRDIAIYLVGEYARLQRKETGELFGIGPRAVDKSVERIRAKVFNDRSLREEMQRISTFGV